MTLGSRVLSENPQPSTEDWSLPEPTQDTLHEWRLLDLDVMHADGRAVQMQLLRPAAWLVKHGLQEGVAVELPPSELGPSAAATLRRIARCPAIADGEGHVVTGRFVTTSAVEVHDLIVEDDLGRHSTLRGTPSPPCGMSQSANGSRWERCGRTIGSAR